VRRGSTYEQVGEDRGSKEMDGCSLTTSNTSVTDSQYEELDGWEGFG
jgi:hypothetical protein